MFVFLRNGSACVTFGSLNKQYTRTDRTNTEVEAWLGLWCGEYSEGSC